MVGRPAVHRPRPPPGRRAAPGRGHAHGEPARRRGRAAGGLHRRLPVLADPTAGVGQEAAAFAYLRTAVIRKAIDGIRRGRPSAELRDEPVDDPGLLRYEDDRAFFARLGDLPKQQRAVLVLRYYLDLDDRRIADVLGISRATVRSNAMRGLDRLRAQNDVVEEGR